MAGIKFRKTHPESACKGRVCIVHNPTDHHMRDWPAHWRSDTGVVERICPCGIGHPDPDQFEYWRESGQEWKGIHGCCREHCHTDDGGLNDE